MRKLAIFILVLALFPFAGVAGAAGARMISVSGQASVEARPDMAQITLGVVRQAATAEQALAAVRQAAADVFARLGAAGIAARDMQTANLGLRPLYASHPQDAGQPPQIVGYQASNMLRVRVRDLEALGPVLDAVARAGANQFSGLSFGLQDPAGLEMQAREAAVRDARARAEALARAAGVELGAVLSITDQSGGPAPVMMMRDMAARAEAMPVAAGELSVEARVSIVFAIAE